MKIQSEAFGIGIRREKDNKVLDVFFPIIYAKTQDTFQEIIRQNIDENVQSTDSLVLSKEIINTIYNQCKEDLKSSSDYKTILEKLDILSNTKLDRSYGKVDIIAIFFSDLNQPIHNSEEAYFKLHCLSCRLYKPHSINLEGLFGSLTNVAWTNRGPILQKDLDNERLKYQGSDSPLMVTHIDKFPYLVNYHIPSGVRIASGSQVRLGAYLGEGTTIMPAGYVNFNAGSEGETMIEGRVSAGVVLGKKTDIGGGASIMGTLSGGNQHIVSIGAKCLLGANSGTGISIGDGCTIAAGVYITAGTKISLYNEKNEPVNRQFEVTEEGQNVVKAWELSGKDHLLFYQDSQSGIVICKPNSKTIELNATLHSND